MISPHTAITLSHQRDALVCLGQLAKVVEQMREFWRNGTPVHPGSLLAEEACKTLDTIMEGPLPSATPEPRSRVLTPIELALEVGALLALWGEQHTFDGFPESPACVNWTKIRAGLQASGVLGYVRRSWSTPPRPLYSGYMLVYELFPDDPEYYGLVGDGHGDLFAMTRENLIETVLFSQP